MTGVVSVAVALVSEQAFDWKSRPLAVGGMAEIFDARDRRLPREVILKRPRTLGVDGKPLAPDLLAEFRERLETEALILAKLQHPSIVTIHELGRSREGAPFCVLARVEGSALRDMLADLATREAEERRPRTRERIELLTNLLDIAEALACAHDRGIVHRDVTPNNILVGPRGEATLIDWGLAKDLGEDPASSQVGLEPVLPADQAAGGGGATIIAGTPPYVPLEQAMGQSAHPSFDVYSFGATLYHVVAGRPPFGDENPAAYLARLVQGERPPPAAPRDPELSGIIARAMASRPEDRFTAAELLRALREYLTGDLVFSHRYSWTGRAGRWMRKHRAKAAVLGLVLLAAVVFAVAWSVVSERTQRAARLAAEARSRAAAQVASAESRAAAEARRSASAERERSEALGTASAKDAEARQALEEAERADKTSKTYKQLKEVADQKRLEADQARVMADMMAQAAERRAADARATAEQAQAEAEETRRRAEEALTAMASERDQANAARERAENLRDTARAAQEVAEGERDQSRASLRRVETERDFLRQRVRLLERELGIIPKDDNGP
ncbi:MAG TPA: protein kinase [Kofleriaceae bacterium]|nr:protein kinase [Kofleriaceae bacterium]